MILKGTMLPDSVVNDFSTDNVPQTAATASDPWSKFAEVLGFGVTAYNQQQLIQANLERAKLGLPPIDASNLAPTVNVGVSPEIKQLVMIGGLGLLLYFLLKKSRK